MKSRMIKVVNVIVCLGLCFISPAQAEVVGAVRTTLHLVGANDKIVVEAFDDPVVAGVTCYLSRATTGGIAGSLSLAEDSSDASISCQQTGPVSLDDDISSGKRDGEEVFRADTSLLFKRLQVVRFYDRKREALIYLTYSDKVVDGSPKNSLSAVPVGFVKRR